MVAACNGRASGSDTSAQSRGAVPHSLPCTVADPTVGLLPVVPDRIVHRTRAPAHREKPQIGVRLPQTS